MIARLTCCLQHMCCTSWTIHFKEIPGQAEGQAVARGEKMHLLHTSSSLSVCFRGLIYHDKHTFGLWKVELIYKLISIFVKLLFYFICFLDFCAYFTKKVDSSLQINSRPETMGCLVWICNSKLLLWHGNVTGSFGQIMSALFYSYQDPAICKAVLILWEYKKDWQK